MSSYHEKTKLSPSAEAAAAAAAGNVTMRRSVKTLTLRGLFLRVIFPYVHSLRSLSRISAVRGCASIRDTNVSQRTATTGGFFWPKLLLRIKRRTRGGIEWMDGWTPLLPPPAFPSSSTVAEKGPRPPMLYTVRTGTFRSRTVREWRARATCPKILSGPSASPARDDATLHFVPVARMHSPAAFVAMPRGGMERECNTRMDGRTLQMRNIRSEGNYWAERGAWCRILLRP